MRYILETKTKKEEGIIEELTNKEKIKLIDNYDPYEKLSKDVEKVGLALRQFQKSGIDWSVFKTYLRGCGYSVSLIDGFMGNVNQFFTKIGLLPEKKQNKKTGKYEY